MSAERDHTWAHRLGRRYLVLACACTVLALVAAGLVRLEHLSPNAHRMMPGLFGQLLGLERTLLEWFVLLPALPFGIGLPLLAARTDRGLAFPRLARAAWWLLLAGLGGVLHAFVAGGVETGWVYAVAHPGTHARVAPSYLGGLLLAGVGLQLQALVLLATLRRSGLVARSVFAAGLAAACLGLLVAMPIRVAALAAALGELWFPLGLFDAARGGDPLLLPVLHAFAATPLQMTMITAVLAAVAHALDVDRHLDVRACRHARGALLLLPVMALPAVDTQGLPQVLSPLLVLAGGWFHVLLMLPLFLCIGLLFRGAAAHGHTSAPRPHYGMAALVLVTLLAPLDLFLRMPYGSLYHQGYLGSAVRLLLPCGATLFAALALATPGAPQATRHGWFGTALLTFGLLATGLPLLVLGARGLAPELAVYPPELLPWQVLVLAGGSVLALGTARALWSLLHDAPSRPPVHA